MLAFRSAYKMGHANVIEILKLAEYSYCRKPVRWLIVLQNKNFFKYLFINFDEKRKFILCKRCRMMINRFDFIHF